MFTPEHPNTPNQPLSPEIEVQAGFHQMSPDMLAAKRARIAAQEAEERRGHARFINRAEIFGELPVSLWRNTTVEDLPPLAGAQDLPEDEQLIISTDAQRTEQGLEFKAGTTMTTDEAAAFSDKLSTRLHELSRKEQLTSGEISFIGRTNSMLARVINSRIESDGVKLPEETATDVVARAKRLMANANMTVLADVSDSRDPVLASLAPIAADSVTGVRVAPNLRVNYDDLAIALTKAFAELVKANGGLRIDEHTASTLGNVVAHYRKITPEAKE